MKNKEIIKVLIAFDQLLVAEGLEAILSDHGDIKVVGLLENSGDINNLVSKQLPDIIIFEFSIWLSKHTDYLIKFRNAFPELRIIILSELISQELLDEIMPNIDGYLIRTCAAEKVILAIHEVYTSGKYLCPKALEEYFNGSGKTYNNSKLSAREKEILGTWLRSKNNIDMADKLNISESTVRTHLKNIREKLGNINHVEMMVYACKENASNRNFVPICPNCRSFCRLK